MCFYVVFTVQIGRQMIAGHFVNESARDGAKLHGVAVKLSDNVFHAGQRDWQGGISIKACGKDFTCGGFSLIAYGNDNLGEGSSREEK